MIKRSRQITAITVSCCLLLALTGCAAYKARPLLRLTPDGSSLKKDTIVFAHRIFNRTDCKKYLDRDVIKQGYQPIHITIVNNTDRTVYFSRNNISLVTVDADEVAQTVHTDTAGRAVGYGVGALFLFPLAIPAIVDGVGSAQANKQLDSDFDSKMLGDTMIHPGEMLNGLIFVPTESFKPDFEIRLTSTDGSEPIVLRAGNAQLSEFCN